MRLDEVITAGTSKVAAINNFSGRWAFLSNFYPAPVHWEQITYRSAEHAFNAGKSLDMRERLWVADAHTAREAKRRGRQVALRPRWDERVRYQVMAEVLRAKFSGERLAAALLSTGDARLVEGNKWHDQTWGDCLCGRPACVSPGENHLGRLLVELRESIRVSSVGAGSGD